MEGLAGAPKTGCLDRPAGPLTSLDIKCTVAYTARQGHTWWPMDPRRDPSTLRIVTTQGTEIRVRRFVLPHVGVKG
jgi:hypothetical protein